MPDAGADLEYLRLSQKVRALLCWQMKENGISRADLARRMKVTPGRVSQLLSGDENLTLRTLAAITSCLGARFEMELLALRANAHPAATVDAERQKPAPSHTVR